MTQAELNNQLLKLQSEFAEKLLDSIIKIEEDIERHRIRVNQLTALPIEFDE